MTDTNATAASLEVSAADTLVERPMAMATPPNFIPGPRLYHVGTLTYDALGLVKLFAWLLWGDFCFGIMEIMMPQLLPITLHKLGASNTFMSIVMGIIPSGMVMAVVPVCATISDRHRGPRGRRIPFLLWTTPFLVFFLAMIGWSPTIGNWLHNTFPRVIFFRSSKTLILALICISMILFQFLNSMSVAIYSYLWADVVPSVVLGRFISYFRVVGQLALFVWGRWIFGKADHHADMVYFGVCLLYLVSFVAMCWGVKEGQYPPPPPVSPSHGPGFLARSVRSIRDYIYEAFEMPIYRWYLIMWSFMTVTEASLLYQTLFCTETLKLTMDQVGKTLAWATLPAIPFLLLAGWVADKIHPLRLHLLANFLTFVVTVASFYCIHDARTLLIFYVILTNSITLQLRAIPNMTLGPMLFPKEQYGQMTSAASSSSHLAGMIAAGLVGVFMDHVRKRLPLHVRLARVLLHSRPHRRINGLLALEETRWPGSIRSARGAARRRLTSETRIEITVRRH